MAFDKTAQYQAYSMASQTVSKTRQVVMLYDGAIRFMKQAREAIVDTRIEDKFNLLNKTSEIVVSLQGCLDFENGGDIAQILYDYYSSLDARILNIHRTNNLEMVDSVIDNLKQMRDAWGNIDSMGEAKSEADTPEVIEVSEEEVVSSPAATARPSDIEALAAAAVFVSA